MFHLTPQRVLQLVLLLLSTSLFVLTLDVAQAALVFSPSRALSTTTIASPLNPSVVGQTVTFTIAVQGSGAIPTGSVTTTVDGNDYYGCKNSSLDGSGHAQCAIANFNAGTHNVAASYSGDGNYDASTSNTVVQSVSPISSRGLFVSSCGTASVKRYDASTGAYVSDFASGSGLACPGGLTFGPDNNLYVSSFAGGVLRYNGSTGAFIDTFVSGTDAPSATGLAMDSQGNVFVGTSVLLTTSVKRREHTTGTVTTLDAPASYRAAGVSARSDGHVFVNDATNSKFLHFDNAGTYIGIYPTTNVLNPTGNTLGPDGLLYVAASDWLIGRYDPDTGAYIGAFAYGFNYPWGIAFGPDGNLYVASRSDHKIIVVDGMTGASLGDFVAAGSGSLSAPQYLTFAPMLTSTLSLSSSAPAMITGHSVTFTATVSEATPLTPEGTVAFHADGPTVADCAASALDSAGQATCTIATFMPGTHVITATYSGDTDFAPSSATLTPDEAVYDNSTSVAVSSSANPASLGQAITFTATVSETTPFTATGTVAFKDGGVAMSGCAAKSLDSAEQATCTVSTLTGGTHVITAFYSGDADFGPSSGMLAPDEAVSSGTYLPLLKR